VLELLCSSASSQTTSFNSFPYSVFQWAIKKKRDGKRRLAFSVMKGSLGEPSGSIAGKFRKKIRKQT
jgi:hypothetical protein